jgi:FkbM family methyltransferase
VFESRSWSPVLRDIAKAFARSVGLEIRRFAPASSHAAQLKAMLEAHRVNLILDVGANVGQFGAELRRHVGFKGRLVSFEPMRQAHAVLKARAAGDGLWEVAPRAAIGARDGAIAINVSENSVSSSVLPMLEAHSKAAPGSRYSSTEEVPLTRLDVAANSYFANDSIAFLKIDTQGYEWEVLEGATETLRRVVGVQLEVSLIPLYDGQKLMPELVDEMNRRGFSLWAIAPAFADPGTGRLLQADATFFKSGTY